MIRYASLVLVVLVATVRSFPKTDSDLKESRILPFIENSNSIATKDDIDDNVDFYLYTQKTWIIPVKTRITDSRLFGGKIDVAKPVKILIHGFLSDKDGSLAKTLREAYLKKGDFNVISVDWSKNARAKYEDSRNDVPKVGKVVAKFIDKLVNDMGLQTELVHVVGHSLGAHVAGVAGLNVRSGSLLRVTGLDPALPNFSYDDVERLRPSSAGFVDVIHTCGKLFGFYGNLGDVDFYPNGGTPSQPGCTIEVGSCSHERAITLFAESISTSIGFVSRKCDDWDEFTGGKCDNNPTASMGENASFDARGKYYLRTGKSSPYALGPVAASGKINGISTAALQFLQG